jgi:hypothetical protein
MSGRIYTDQKCLLFGCNYNYNDRGPGLSCPDHPDQMATGRFRVRLGHNTRKRFSYCSEKVGPVVL